MSKNKIIAIIIIVVFLIAAVIVGVFLVTREESQDIRTDAAPSTTISLVPATSNKSVGETFVLIIEVATGENQVVSADAVVDFDPDILKAVSVADGSFFTNPQVINNTIDPAGSIIYSSRVSSKDEAVTGTGTLATITFEAVGGGTDIVTFSNLTSVHGLGENENVLVSKNPSNVTVTGSASPSPSPITSPSPTATASASATPTATSTPQTLPDTGVSDPAIMGIGVGTLLLIVAATVVAL